MDQPFSVGRTDVELTAPMERVEGVPDAETPFRILVIGDVTGRANRGLVGPAADAHKPIQVDRDGLDSAIRRFAPELRLNVPAAGATALVIKFETLNDFHPDRLFDRLDAFQALKTLRERLHNRDSYEAAAAEVRSWVAPAARAGPPARGPKPPDPELSEGEQVVRELLEGRGRQASERAPRAGGDWNAFLQQIVAPYIVAREDPQQAELVSAVDRATGALMRAVLQHPAFQGLEAAWRAVDVLVRRLETGSDLQLWLLDACKAELAAAFTDGSDPGSSWINHVLVEQTVGTPGGVPWAVLIGNYTFESSQEDLTILSAMARLAHAAGAPFVAAASPRLLGCESLEHTPDPDDWRRRDEGDTKRWMELRRSPEAAYVGLALPRFLLRLPYGREGERLEAFEFEELPDGGSHDAYLWGNPAFGCAYLLGRAFSEHGWGFRPGAVQEIDDLPIYVFKDDGERRVKPCAEVLLTLRGAELILDRGLMPLLSFRDRDIVRLARFQSIRDPLTPLAGRWSS